MSLNGSQTSSRRTGRSSPRARQRRVVALLLALVGSSCGTDEPCGGIEPPFEVVSDPHDQCPDENGCAVLGTPDIDYCSVPPVGIGDFCDVCFDGACIYVVPVDCAPYTY